MRWPRVVSSSVQVGKATLSNTGVGGDRDRDRFGEDVETARTTTRGLGLRL